MNFASELLEFWGAAMWRASWQGALAVLAVWSVCRLVPSIPARFQCWLWRVAMLKFVVALLWGMPIELPLLPAQVVPSTTNVSLEASSPIAAETISTALVPSDPQRLSSIATLLLATFLAWIAIVGWQMARLAAGWLSANKLRRHCRPSDNLPLITQLATLTKSLGLRTPPVLLEMEGQGSPLLLGILRPAIVLPTATLSRLNAAERTVVLGHELAHACRGDLLWSVVAALVRAFFSFHPLAWLSERQLSLAQEIAADELAISLEKRDPVGYATQLVSVVSKLGPFPLLPALSVGMAGSHRSLQQRLSAMRFMKPVSTKISVVYAFVLGTIALLGMVPWVLVAAEPAAAETTRVKVPDQATEKKADKAPDRVPDKAPQQVEAQTGKQEKREHGRFVSFKNGTLTIMANSGALLENKIPDNAKTLVWNDEKGMYVAADTVATLRQAEPGLWMIVLVANDNFTLRVGSKKGKTVGTFVSFKAGRLLMLGTNLGESFTKKYGNNVHFNKFREDVPAYESIDGGEYKQIGTANKVLSEVKEGTVLTIYGEGDDNITRVEIGVAKKP